MSKMINFVIDNEDKLKQKMDLISNLIDIKAAVTKRETRASKKNNGCKAKGKAAEKEKKIELEPNPIDENYENLNCDINVLDPKNKEYALLQEYFLNSSAGRGCKLQDIFKLERNGEKKIFNPHKLGNKKLLWHGSRFSNFVGILSNGMRIAPPEAPKTGYNYGKGVYFADLASKSCSYCCPYLSGGVGIFVLCEVALGNPR